MISPGRCHAAIWPAAFGQFLKRPWVGYGSENVGFFFPAEFGGASIDRAHNAFLDALLVGGVFLGAVYLIFVLSALFKGLVGKIDLGSFLAFSGTMVMDQVNVGGIVNLVLFWLLLAVLLPTKLVEKTARTPTKLILIGLAVILLALGVYLNIYVAGIDLFL